MHALENPVRERVPAGGGCGTAPVPQGAYGVLGSAAVGVWHTEEEQSLEAGDGMREGGGCPAGPPSLPPC